MVLAYTISSAPLPDQRLLLAQQEPKQVNLTVRSLALPSVLLSGHRYVDAKKNLEVRASARMNAKAIGTIERAAVVQVVKVDGSWTLIRWTDADQNLLVQGWVLTRYLTKFN